MCRGSASGRKLRKYSFPDKLTIELTGLIVLKERPSFKLYVRPQLYRLAVETDCHSITFILITIFLTTLFPPGVMLGRCASEGKKRLKVPAGTV